jgi:hypothetical protein
MPHEFDQAAYQAGLLAGIEARVARLQAGEIAELELLAADLDDGAVDRALEQMRKGALRLRARVGELYDHRLRAIS